MIGGFEYLDVALFAILVVSGLVAMYRGLTREVLSILSWVAAAGACLYFVFKHRDWAEKIAGEFHVPLLVAQVAIGGLIFLVVLIVVHLITARISDTVLDSRVGAIDRVLGLAFGLGRGFVLIVIPYMFVVSFMCKEGAPRSFSQGCRPGDLPAWIERARSLPLISGASESIYSVLTRYAPAPTPSGDQQQG